MKTKNTMKTTATIEKRDEKPEGLVTLTVKISREDYCNMAEHFAKDRPGRPIVAIIEFKVGK